MRLSNLITVLGAFVVAGGLSVLTAYFSVELIEDASSIGVEAELETDGLGWARVDTTGLQVFLIGTAPDEAARFKALSAAGRVVDPARLIDQMLVEEAAEIAPPRFSMEILRNDAGLSVIGLVPAAMDRAALVAEYEQLTNNGSVSDLLETADFPTPEGWDSALRFAATAMRDLPRSKVSVAADRVAIKAMVDSAEAKRRIEADLARRTPSGLRLALDISAPRPVITPFTLRFLIDDSGARFDACSADTDDSRNEILRAANRAGAEGKLDCTIGLGVPSRHWAQATSTAIGKLRELGSGSVTFTNADVMLVGVEGTDQAVFDRVAGELEAALPEVFALTAILPKAPEAREGGVPEFTATLSPEGSVQLRGRFGTEISRQTADSFARARFGSTAVYMAARVDESLPNDWAVRTLAALQALSMLANGSVKVTEENVSIQGQTGLQDASTEIAALMATKLGENTTFDIAVEYVKKFDPTLGLPTPDECETGIIEIIGDRKLSFEPGSATLGASAKDILDDLAEYLRKCGEIPLEIGGHTDNEGRESMNQQLSQDRAQAVLEALRTRRVPTLNYSVRGYGESTPIADNGTAEGREANRRIAFTLLRDQLPTVEAAVQGDPSQAVETAAEPVLNEDIAARLDAEFRPNARPADLRIPEGVDVSAPDVTLQDTTAAGDGEGATERPTPRPEAPPRADDSAAPQDTAQDAAPQEGTSNE